MKRCDRSTWLAKRVFPLLLAAGIPFVATAAQAADPAVCIQNHEFGQRSQQESKLLEARTLFAKCSRSECPLAVAQDCERLSAALAGSIPSIVLGAKTKSGLDTNAVDVVVDAKPHPLNGVAVELDPGQHRVEFRWHGGSTTHTEFLLKEGEKRRLIHGIEPTTPPARLPLTTPIDVTEPTSTPGYLPHVLAGVGIAALAGFTFFALQGNGRQDCKPECTQAQADAMRTSYLLADVSLGVSLLALGGAGYFYLKPERTPSDDPSSTEALSITAGLAGSF